MPLLRIPLKRNGKELYIAPDIIPAISVDLEDRWFIHLQGNAGFAFEISEKEARKLLDQVGVMELWIKAKER